MGGVGDGASAFLECASRKAGRASRGRASRQTLSLSTLRRSRSRSFLRCSFAGVAFRSRGPPASGNPGLVKLFLLLLRRRKRTCRSVRARRAAAQLHARQKLTLLCARRPSRPPAPGLQPQACPRLTLHVPPFTPPQQVSVARAPVSPPAGKKEPRNYFGSVSFPNTVLASVSTLDSPARPRQKAGRTSRGLSSVVWSELHTRLLLRLACPCCAT